MQSSDLALSVLGDDLGEEEEAVSPKRPAKSVSQRV